MRQIASSDGKDSRGEARGTWLPPLGGGDQSFPLLGGFDHPHNALVRKSMEADAGADSELRQRYDQQAGIWNEWIDSLGTDYARPVVEGFNHARAMGVAMSSVAEFSAGTGAGTVASGLGAGVVLCDVSFEMLSQADPATFPRRVVASNGALPFASDVFDLGFALNGVPHPAEFLRVLRPVSWLLWAYSHHSDTPVYVPFDVLAIALNAKFTAQRVGAGSWALFSIGHTT